jgi:UDP-N-acetylmuramyl pentapeptide phosphotransferase/UDP-N-acetylglucosamine-1-phosphate transferase
MASFVASYFGVAGVRALGLKRNFLDVPNERSSHVKPTPSGGGIAIVLASLVFYCVVAYILPQTFSWGYLAGALLVAGISLIDDIYGISVIWRLLTHAAAAALLIADKGYWHSFYVIGTSIDLNLGTAGAVITFIWIVWLINAYNFMDGIDGIAGVQSIAAAAGWFAIGWLIGSPTAFYLGGVLIFATLGFLIHNWQPARIFMGDVGSAFLGFTFAALPLLAVGDERTYVFLPMTGILLVWLFLFDTDITLIRRALRREKIWQAHRLHVYQRLVQGGLSHATVTTLYGILAIAITASVVYIYADESANLLVPLFTAAIATVVLVVVFLWRRRRKH